MATKRKTIAKNPLMGIQPRTKVGEKKKISSALTKPKAVKKRGIVVKKIASKKTTAIVKAIPKGKTKKIVAERATNKAVRIEFKKTKDAKASLKPNLSLVKASSSTSIDELETILAKKEFVIESANAIFDAEISALSISTKRGILAEADRFERSKKIIVKWSRISLLTIAVPNTVLEYVVISGMQVRMLQEVSRVYGVPFKADAVKVIVGSILGGGIAYFLSDFYSSWVRSIPVVGKPISFLTEPAIAYVTTYAVGLVFLEHFERNGSFQNIDLESIKKSIKEKVNQKYQELLQSKKLIGSKNLFGLNKAST
jgi:uncharacterized protein (DUF697 family)